MSIEYYQIIWGLNLLGRNISYRTTMYKKRGEVTENRVEYPFGLFNGYNLGIYSPPSLASGLT